VRVVALITQLELRSYRRTLLATNVISAGLLVSGLLFYVMALTRRLLSAEVVERFFVVTSGVVMVASVLLSARLIAEERQTGTLTLLRVSPARDSEVVLGKFLAALIPISLMILLTLPLPLWVLLRGHISWGHLAVGYAGLFLLGAACSALGIFASALARTPIIAVVLGLLLLGIFLLWWALALVSPPPLRAFLSALALHNENFRPFTAGVLVLRGVAYYVVLTTFLLFAAGKVLEARRWR
jgi:ABC-2 type transport system permease protein